MAFKLQEQPAENSGSSQPVSPNEGVNSEEPSLEYKYSYYINGIKEYEKFLRDGYFDIYQKEVEYQLQKDGLAYHVALSVESNAVKNYESYRKFLIHEHNKIVAIETAEEADIRKGMLSSCTGIPWPSVVKILERRQKIVMKRKQSIFEKELSYIEARTKIMLCCQYFKDNDGLSMFLKEKKLADYLSADGPSETYKNLTV